MPYLHKNGDRREIIDTTKNGKIVFYKITDSIGVLSDSIENLTIRGWEVIEDEKQTPWTPEVGQEYFSPDIRYPKSDGGIDNRCWQNNKYDLHSFSIGIVCRTRAEAEAKYDEIISKIQ